ncbi:MAG: hypothetical protein ABIG71_01770, partial [Candidatus Uhrbacteria bacterium]
FPILMSSKRNLAAEATCTKAFTNSKVTLYKDGVQSVKSKGTAPSDVWDWSFVRACAYSGAPFLERFTKR